MLFKQMSIIGVGLIGGSLGLAVKQAKIAGTVVGYGRRRGALHKAVSLNAIDRYCLSLSKAVEDADLVVLATPVGTFERILVLIAPHLKEGAIITDVGSVKGNLIETLDKLTPASAHFVGGHPIAGREKSGILAAIGTLFQGCCTIITPIEQTNRNALGKIRSLWENVGAKVTTLDPFEHDRILGVVSHLPHLVAYALMETLHHPRIAPLEPVQYSAGGLRDFTRIAGSSAEMWRDIFLQNRTAIVEAIDAYQESIEAIKKKILSEDSAALLEIFERAKAIRKKVAQ